jgi:integrase
VSGLGLDPPALEDNRREQLRPEQLSGWGSVSVVLATFFCRYRNATANRILTVAKAALNHAWKAGHVASDDAWRRVRPFKAAETARVHYLNEAECVRLVNACEPTFRDLVRAALLTGCRYAELASLHAADFNPDAGVITVRTSKAGRPRHVVLTDEGQLARREAPAGDLSLSKRGSLGFGDIAKEESPPDQVRGRLLGRTH